MRHMARTHHRPRALGSGPLTTQPPQPHQLRTQRLLGDRFGALRESDDPRADLLRAVQVFRVFVRDSPVLAQVMFSRPFADFDPGPAELEAGAATREFIVHQVRRCTDAGIIDGDQADIAHGLLALAQGLAMQESAGWLGSSRASVNRRWDLAVHALLAGLGPAAKGR